MPRRSTATRARTERRIAELIRDFDRYVSAFEAANLFTGPSLHFHLRTSRVRAAHRMPSAAAADPEFAELLYATLTAWGMHRMGPTGAKLVGFESFRGSLVRHAAELDRLDIGGLVDASLAEVGELGARAANLIDSLGISTSATQIVAGSKTLHHLVPNIIPPIDREYTLRFFFDHKSIYGDDRALILELLPHFQEIARANREAINRLLGHGMNTSTTKVIDNALVGYVLTHLKAPKPR